MTTDTVLDQRIRRLLREAFDQEIGPDPTWADSPAARRIERLDGGGRRGRWPLRLLAIAAMVGTVLGAALLGGGAGPRSHDLAKGPTDAPSSSPPASPEPTATPATSADTTPPPSPQAGHDLYVSVIHGITMDIPAGWRVRSATQAWDGRSIDPTSPMADVISDPALGDQVRLMIASSLYQDALDYWRHRVYAWVCPSGAGLVDGWDVDAHEANWRPCADVDTPVLIYGEDRGWAIWLLVSKADPKLAATYDLDWLKAYLGTVHLRERDAVNATG